MTFQMSEHDVDDPPGSEELPNFEMEYDPAAPPYSPSNAYYASDHSSDNGGTPYSPSKVYATDKDLEESAESDGGESDQNVENKDSEIDASGSCVFLVNPFKFYAMTKPSSIAMLFF